MKTHLLQGAILLLFISTSATAKELTLSDAISRAQSVSHRLRSAEAQLQSADQDLALELLVLAIELRLQLRRYRRRLWHRISVKYHPCN